ncbi:MAG: hypothetical protein E4H11_10055 [Myxococcales bacterium]|nr:MAG: hypothetical protein E4H11_10055 [Myxococcales bacterium]
MEYDETPESDGLMDAFRDPRGMLRRRWRWMLLALVGGLAISLPVVATRKARYAATATVLITTQQIREDLVRTTLQDDLLKRIDAMVGDVLSRESLVDLIQKHDPYPELRETVGMSDIVERVRKDIAFRSQEGVEARRPDSSVRLFTLSVEAGRPDVAAGFANDLATRLVDRSIRRRTQEAGLALSFLRGELDRAEQEMRENSRAIRELKEQYRGELPRELPANLARLERLQQQRQSLALQIAETNTQQAELLVPSGSARDDLSPEARLAALRVDLKRQEGLLTQKHPEIQWLRRQVDALEVELGASATDPSHDPPTRSGLIAATQETVEELRRQLARTETELVDLDARVARTPSRLEELATLEERAEVLQESYRDFLRKVQEGELAASLESAQQGERFSVLEQAEPPSRPTGSRWKMLAVGCMASFALAVGVGILLEMLDPVLVTARQVKAESGLQVLGSAPHIS